MNVRTKPSIMNMLVRAGHAFVAAEGKDPVAEGAALADYIRKGNLDQGELELIAQLVMGYWRREQKGGARVSPAKKRAVVKVYKDRVVQCKRGGAKKVKAEIAREFNITEGQLKHWITWVNGRAKS